MAKAASEIILQPMTSLPEVRRFAVESGYTISEEVLAKEGRKLYSVIKLIPVPSEDPGRFYDLIPKILIDRQDPNLPLLIDREAKRLEKQIAGLKHAHNSQPDQIAELESLLQESEGCGMKMREIIDVMEMIAPPELAEEWDNPGLMVGIQKSEDD